MNIRQQLTIQESLDPFTLLKVCQALQEISCGESLEISCSGSKIPDELFKILPPQHYEIIERELSEDRKRCRVVIQKKTTASPGPATSGGGCCC